MVPRTVRNRGGSIGEFYLCYGRALARESCDMPPTKRADVDAAVFAYFEQVGLDLDATREQLREAVERKVAEVKAQCEAAERDAQEAVARLDRVKRDYANGDLTAAEWRELRADFEPEREAAEGAVQRLRKQLAATEESAAVADAEAELVEQIAAIRAAVAGEVTDAASVQAVRAALLRLFDGFRLHRGAPERAHVELIAERWIEPLFSEKSLAGQVGQQPVLDRMPLGQAANNCYAALLL